MFRETLAIQEKGGLQKGKEKDEHQGLLEEREEEELDEPTDPLLRPWRRKYGKVQRDTRRKNGRRNEWIRRRSRSRQRCSRGSVEWRSLPPKRSHDRERSSLRLSLKA